MKRLAIHIVEDEAIITLDLEDILQELGHSVSDTSMSYEEVIEKLQEDQSDLFLVDIQLRGLETGIDLAHELDAHDIPHIFVSSIRDYKMLTMAQKTNALGYILKPFELSDIFVALQMAIGKIENNQLQQSVFIKEGRVR